MKIRIALLAAALAIGMQRPAAAQVQIGVGIALPGVRIGINVPAYPNLVAIPAYPVYYAPGLDLNLFFYDGLYWVFVDDRWYSSSWYDGPWTLVEPDYVPYFILRVPILYYRAPPPYFRDWDRRRPPHWGERFGSGWRERHRDWDRWNRAAVPPRAPRPIYQRRYSGPRYPDADRQRQLENRYYRYQPRERQPMQQRAPARPPAPGREGPRGPERGQGYGRPAAPPPPGRYQARPGPQRGTGAPPAPPERRQPPIYRAPPQGPRPQAQQLREQPRPADRGDERRRPPEQRQNEARPPRER